MYNAIQKHKYIRLPAGIVIYQTKIRSIIFLKNIFIKSFYYGYLKKKLHFFFTLKKNQKNLNYNKLNSDLIIVINIFF